MCSMNSIFKLCIVKHLCAFVVKTQCKGQFFNRRHSLISPVDHKRVLSTLCKIVFLDIYSVVI